MLSCGIMIKDAAIASCDPARLFKRSAPQGAQASFSHETRLLPPRGETVIMAPSRHRPPPEYLPAPMHSAAAAQGDVSVQRSPG